MVALVIRGRKSIKPAKACGCDESRISDWGRQSEADTFGGGKPGAPLATAER
jgi:hypothetical protein